MRQSTVFKTRRIVALVAALSAVVGFLWFNPANWEINLDTSGGASHAESDSADGLEGFEMDGSGAENAEAGEKLAIEVLAELEVKGRAPKTGYERTEFYNNWPTVDGCSLRQRIIKREFGETAVMDGCNVISGKFYEPYTGKILEFSSKSEISSGIQIDHVVALSDAWQKGAQYKTKEERYAMATDPLNLLAVDSSANQKKSDGDAATWLPSNKSFRCQYVARQVSVKFKYQLWVTEAEKEAITNVLSSCPNQKAYGV